MAGVRQPAVAGAFYPGTARELDAAVKHHLAKAARDAGPVPKAIIAPHAGYVYSGPVAATAYARIQPARGRIKRVVLLGPCHRVAVRGLAASSADAFATPLGNIPVDREALDRILKMPQVQVFDATHSREHSLEVHLPFLQVVLGAFALVPLVVGEATPDEVAAVIEALWGGPETLVVVSTDLSHFLDYDTARRVDAATCEAIEAFEPKRIGREQACGRIPMNGLLALAKRRGLEIVRVDVRNSGDTAGARDQVVGYGSWLLFEDAPAATKEDSFAAATRALLANHGATLLHVAAASIEHGLATGRPLAVDVKEYAGEIAAKGACFVTLKRDGKLRGCIGSSGARRPLVTDAAENAFAAAFRDRRFQPLKRDDLQGLDLSVSVLSAAVPMKFADQADFMAQLRPKVDGLIIEDGGKRALFLPSVWESLPKPGTFLAHLKMKAGMKPEHWSKNFKAWRFIAEEIYAADLDDPAALWSGPEKP